LSLPKWYELPHALITEPGTAKNYLTGTWRTKRPVTDKSKCIKCGICWIFCPDMSREKDENGFYDTNFDYCKGCGICAAECPTSCIKMVPEEV
jgi:pyruvate ferredoxin oxidoreductase delta subunit